MLLTVYRDILSKCEARQLLDRRQFGETGTAK